MLNCRKESFSKIINANITKSHIQGVEDMKQHRSGGEIAHCVRELIILAEAMDLIPRTHMTYNNHL